LFFNLLLLIKCWGIGREFSGKFHCGISWWKQRRLNGGSGGSSSGGGGGDPFSLIFIVQFIAVTSKLGGMSKTYRKFHIFNLYFYFYLSAIILI